MKNRYTLDQALECAQPGRDRLTPLPQSAVVLRRLAGAALLVLVASYFLSLP